MLGRDVRWNKQHSNESNLPLLYTVLAHYESSHPLILACDSSSYSIGTVLSQTMSDGNFFLLTDHQPLQFLFNPRKDIPVTPAAQLQRWCLLLSAYDYEIKFCASEWHANCDGLS